MKNKILIFTVIITAGLFLLNSCKKDKKTETPAPVLTKTQMLTAKTWKISASVVDPAIDWDGNGTMVTDIYNQMNACEKDDIAKFNTNNTYSLEEGVSVCNTGDPQVYETGTWAFNSDESVLLMTPSGGTVISNSIVSLSSTTLKLSYFVTGGTNYTYTETYTAQ